MLNEEQRDFILRISDYFFSQCRSPFYALVSRGAGVGKSLLIKALFQHFTVNIINREPGNNPDDVKILHGKDNI